MPRDEGGEADAGTIRLRLQDAKSLPEFLADRRILTIGERRLIVEQAIGMLEHVYVHLPVKQKLYDIDPIARLRALRERLEGGGPADDLPFHRDMVAIMSTCRDMHTGYYLPRPFDRGVAFLPFQIEEFDDGGIRRYVVPRVLPDDPEIAATPDFQRGVEILSWDGDPIDDAVVREGEASPGINAGARHARGVYRLTTRYLAKCPPPERETVRVTYLTQGGARGTLDVRWRVASLPAEIASLPEGAPIGQAPRGLDFETEVFRALKTELSARHMADPLAAVDFAAPLPTSLPSMFEAFVRKGADDTEYGHLRIRSFVVDDADRAHDEFVRLVRALPAAGLVIDVRDNPGGSIQAAEMILQALAPRRLDRASLVFRATAFIQRLCERQPDVYARWTPSIARAQRTGLAFSGGVPLWRDEAYDSVQCCHAGPLVLIVNALSYSATDFFAAGFQDHELGLVLGLHPTTGGGGADVRSLQSLVQEIGADRDMFAGTWMPVSLPLGADIHVAFRRSLRTGRHAGLEVEDFGVEPDDRPYPMTRQDAMEGNPGLFAAAVKMLERQRPKAG